MKVAVVDYGMGNLGSVRRALNVLGARADIAHEPEDLRSADRMVLPGVGNFADAMVRLAEKGWIDAIRGQVAAGKPLLGVCLGMQLLAERGTEGGDNDGLGLIPGEIVRLDTLGCRLRIPHVGWNSVSLDGTGRNDAGVFTGVPDGTDFYFVHSYAFRPKDPVHVLAWAQYGVPVVAAVGRGNVFGTQFHPEKSSKGGFRVIKNFLDYRPC